MGFFSGTSSPGSKDPASASARSEDHQADAELQGFLRQLSTEAQQTQHNRGRSTAEASTATPGPTEDALDDSKWTASYPQAAGPPLHSLTDSLLPSTMSCREAFDAAFYCQSVGGQFNNLYRYGTLRDCGQKWSEFWFCMRLPSDRSRGNSVPQDGADRQPSGRERAVKEYYRRREWEKYGRPGAGLGKSSEDVWKSRDQKLGENESFHLPEPELSDAVKERIDVNKNGLFARGYDLDES